MSSWNDKRVEFLKKLHEEGLSSSQIAARLGGVSRNAVIGKLHRLGLPTRTVVVRKSRAGGRPRRPLQMSRPRRFPSVGNPALRELYQGDTEPYVPPVEDLVIPLHQRRTVETLTETCCRWPIGDPQEADFHFCGRKKIAGLSYCEFHSRRAYQPPQMHYRQGAPAPQPVPAFSDLEKEDA